jgi:hypothetical protein
VLAAGIGSAVVSVSAATVIATIGVVGLALTPIIAVLVAVVRLAALQPKAESAGKLPLWMGLAALIDRPAAAKPCGPAATHADDARAGRP